MLRHDLQRLGGLLAPLGRSTGTRSVLGSPPVRAAVCRQRRARIGLRRGKLRTGLALVSAAAPSSVALASSSSSCSSQLVEQAAALGERSERRRRILVISSLRCATIASPPAARCPGFRLLPRCALGQQRRFQRVNLVRERLRDLHDAIVA
jgi:hypothetical protein